MNTLAHAHAHAHAHVRAHAHTHTDPVALLVGDALVASWIRQGLPSDPTSVGNGAILTNSERWPLMMDPQLQGVLWVKEREAANGLQARGAAGGAGRRGPHTCARPGRPATALLPPGGSRARPRPSRATPPPPPPRGGAGRAHGRRRHDGNHRARDRGRHQRAHRKHGRGHRRGAQPRAHAVGLGSPSPLARAAGGLGRAAGRLRARAPGAAPLARCFVLTPPPPPGPPPQVDVQEGAQPVHQAGGQGGGVQQVSGGAWGAGRPFCILCARSRPVPR